MYGAKELNMPIEKYFSQSKYVVEAQLKMQEKYNNDFLYNFLYAPVEIEAWGGEVIFSKEGPPNSGKPFIHNIELINDLIIPNIYDSKCLVKILNITEQLKKKVNDYIPIVGVVMSPFSLPVMQMGFDKYIQLIYNNPDLFEILIKINESFCLNWANAQIKAGATAICYFDPVSSPSIIHRELYLHTGYKIAKRIIGNIKAPVVTHFASGRCLSILGDLIKTGTLAIGTSCLENISKIKNKAQNNIAIIGNLNGVEMRSWSPEVTESIIKDIICSAAPGGGFILSDNHGEIPYQVPESVLTNISKAVKKWGHYPIELKNDL